MDQPGLSDSRHANAAQGDDSRPDSDASTPTVPLTADADEANGENDEDDDIPLTMNASVVLAELPKDAATALAETVAATSAAQDKKIIVRFKAVGSAPQLAQDVVKISAGRRFEEVVRYLRRKLRCADTDSVFLYVNSAFAPSLDEVVGNLHQVSLGWRGTV